MGLSTERQIIYMDSSILIVVIVKQSWITARLLPLMVLYGGVFLTYLLYISIRGAASFASYRACSHHNFPRSHVLFSPRGSIQRSLAWPTSSHVKRSISSTDTVVDHSNFYSETKVDDDQPGEKLVLREFSMPLQTSLGAYELRVRSKCLEEGGPTAKLIRWNISHADRQTGQAHVEVRPTVSHLQAATNAMLITCYLDQSGFNFNPFITGFEVLH